MIQISTSASSLQLNNRAVVQRRQSSAAPAGAFGGGTSRRFVRRGGKPPRVGSPRSREVDGPNLRFVLHRIREAWGGKDGEPKFAGPVEVDETYMGGKRKNMSNAKRATLEGRGAVGKTAVVGAKDRATKQVAARVVESTDKPTLQGFVGEHAAPGATVYTDEAAAYEGIPYHHETVKHSVAEYVRGMAHTNGMESFWSMLKRVHTGTFHKMSPKHLGRYVRQFAGKHNLREEDTLDIMRHVAAALIGKRLMYSKLIADNGLSSGARG